MRLIIITLIAFLFLLSYAIKSSKQNYTSLEKEYEEALKAINYHAKINEKMGEEVKLLELKIGEINDNQIRNKTLITELELENKTLNQRNNNLKRQNDSNMALIKKKSNELIFLKNELLKRIAK